MIPDQMFRIFFKTVCLLGLLRGREGSISAASILRMQLTFSLEQCMLQPPK